MAQVHLYGRPLWFNLISNAYLNSSLTFPPASLHPWEIKPCKIKGKNAHSVGIYNSIAWTNFVLYRMNSSVLQPIDHVMIVGCTIHSKKWPHLFWMPLFDACFIVKLDSQILDVRKYFVGIVNCIGRPIQSLAIILKNESENNPSATSLYCIL